MLASAAGFWFDAGVKFLLLFGAVAIVAVSCTTLSNRRDLYNPSEDEGPYNSLAPAHPTPAKPAPAPPEENR